MPIRHAAHFMSNLNVNGNAVDESMSGAFAVSPWRTIMDFRQLRTATLKATISFNASSSGSTSRVRIWIGGTWDGGKTSASTLDGTVVFDQTIVTAAFQIGSGSQVFTNLWAGTSPQIVKITWFPGAGGQRASLIVSEVY